MKHTNKGKKCSVECCDREATTKSLCDSHYKRFKSGVDINSPIRAPSPEFCTIEGCGRQHRRNGLCDAHSQQYKNHGKIIKQEIKSVKRVRKSGEGSYSNGYRIILKKDHPNSWSNTGHILEHVFVMSESIGRPILPGETVHHKNGVKDDNRIENLELWSSNHPSGQRVEDKVVWAKEIISLYDNKEEEPLYEGYCWEWRPFDK